MEQKLNCTNAAAVLSAILPPAFQSRAFALHDAHCPFATSLICEMGLEPIASNSEEASIISGPLSDDQEATLTAVSHMCDNIRVVCAQPAQEEVLSDAVGDFRQTIADMLGIPVDNLHIVDGPQGQYLDAIEAPMTAETFSQQLQDELGIPQAEADLTGALAAQGVHPDDFFCMAAGELTDMLGGGRLTFTKDTDGFYVSDAVKAELEAADPPQNDAGVADEAICLPDESKTVETACTEREEILIDAAITVGSHRQNQYGEPEDSLAAIGAYWSVYFGADFSPKDVAVMMALLKIARAENGYHRDNYVDGAGYLALAGEAELNALTTPTTSNGSVH